MKSVIFILRQWNLHCGITVTCSYSVYIWVECESSCVLLNSPFSIVLFTHNLKQKYLFIQEHCLSSVWWPVRMWLVISAVPHVLCRWLHKSVESLSSNLIVMPTDQKQIDQVGITMTPFTSWNVLLKGHLFFITRIGWILLDRALLL